MNKRGQATMEVLLLVPMFTLLIGAGITAIYMGWQNLKVQQAANVAARIQGQERVGGGKDFDSILEANVGKSGSGDTYFDNQGHSGAPDAGSVYGRLYSVAKSFFSSSEIENGNVVVPKPISGQNVDEVEVHRFITLPNIPFLNRQGVNKVHLTARAWGGEDTYMYGLPRWGKTGASSSLGQGNAGSTEYEWQRIIKGSKGSSDQ